MATIEELSDAVATRLEEGVDQLLAALEDDAVDFTEIARRSDELRELAGTIGAFYGELEQMLSDPLQDAGHSEGEHAEEGEVTKEELLERAREANVEGRSTMSKDELAEAVQAEESLTKEELLERARDADIEGRSSMTKDELRTALHDAAA